MSAKDGLVFERYHYARGVVLGDVVGVMAVQGVPGDRDAHRQELERDGACEPAFSVRFLASPTPARCLASSKHTSIAQWLQ